MAGAARALRVRAAAKPNTCGRLADHRAAGFVLNFCCYLGVITGPVAVGLGIVALVQIKNNPKDYGGKPLAIIGIVAGALSFAVFFLFILLGVASALWG